MVRVVRMVRGCAERHLRVWVTSASSGFFEAKSDWRHSCFASPFFCAIDLSTKAAARYSVWLSAMLAPRPRKAARCRRP